MYTVIAIKKEFADFEVKPFYQVGIYQTLKNAERALKRITDKYNTELWDYKICQE